jgi:hypothetical protein
MESAASRAEALHTWRRKMIIKEAFIIAPGGSSYVLLMMMKRDNK